MMRLGNIVKRAWSSFWDPFSSRVSDPIPPGSNPLPDWQNDLTSEAEREEAVRAYIASSNKFLEAAVEVEAIAREQGLSIRGGREY